MPASFGSPLRADFTPHKAERRHRFFDGDSSERSENMEAERRESIANSTLFSSRSAML
ncbi:hypothetical protein [Phyllobacterium sp. SB3]|uniref:hypothetical protein n=1 Tax=Phyllobacterium sp. SB3 TaxID=3156073 RepID=UPI0032AF3BF6